MARALCIGTDERRICIAEGRLGEHCWSDSDEQK